MIFIASCAPEPTVTVSLVLAMWKFLPFPGLTEAGTTDLDQIRADWEFTRVWPISLHTQSTVVHKRLCSADCTGIVK